MEYYLTKGATGRQITSAALIAYESSGDFLKFHPHWHSIILEGGFDEKGNFVYLSISDTKKITELFRITVIKYFQDKELINEKFAKNLLSWKHSGFSVDNSIRIYICEITNKNMSDNSSVQPMSYWS